MIQFIKNAVVNYKKRRKFSKMFLDRCTQRSDAHLYDAILCLLMLAKYKKKGVAATAEDMRMSINLQLSKNGLPIVGVIEFNDALRFLMENNYIAEMPLVEQDSVGVPQIVVD